MTLVYDAPDLESESLRLEQRRACRVWQERPAAAIEPSASRVLQGTTRNVSATGLQIAFDSDAKICTGRILHVHVGRSQGNLCLPNRRHMMPGRVVWCREDERTGEIVCGIEFLPTINACRGAA